MKNSLTCCCLLVLLHFCLGLKNSDKYVSDSDWDTLTYSQRWPITACAEWEEKNSHNTCSLPSDRTIWTVHGIWPDKTGKDGPYFCPSSIHFDPQQLQPIMDQMKSRWINVEANTKMASFWNHEWSKHGTCASSLPQLNSVYNYFKQGLVWNQEYDIALILANGGVKPGETPYNVQDIHDVILGSLNKKPQIFCQVDSKTKESLISEIRICFNKSLELIDCIKDKPVHIKHLEDSDQIITNCKLDKPIKYYADLPLTFNDYEMDTYFNQKENEKQILKQQITNHNKFIGDLMEYLKIINFLSFITL